MSVCSQNTKICNKCNHEKPITTFKKSKGSTGGYSNMCLECHAIYMKSYNRMYNMRHEVKKRRKQDFSNLKKDIKKYKKKCEHNRKRMREYYSRPEVKEHQRKYDKERRETKEYKEKKKEYDKEYRKLNKERYAENRKKRLANNINFKLNYYFSNAIRKALSYNKQGKPWEGIVGYTLKDLKKHLECNFKEGMSWDNYGSQYHKGVKTWHIDHIIPKSLFKFSSLEDEVFVECWSLSNLQPLWEEDNLKKGNRVTEEFNNE